MSVLEHTHVWHLRTSCSMYSCICGETPEAFLLCLRAERTKDPREGWERQVTYAVSCRRGTLGKRKGTCHSSNMTCRSTSADFGGGWIWVRTAHELVHCEEFTFLHLMFLHFNLERMQRLYQKQVTFENATECYEHHIVHNLQCCAINTWRKITSDSWLEFWSRYLVLPNSIDFYLI